MLFCLSTPFTATTFPRRSHCTECTVTHLQLSLSVLNICVESVFESLSVSFFFFLPPPTATMLQMIWKDQLGCFAEYVCESCLDLMASSDIHCQDHKKVRRFTSSGCLRHDFISCCLRLLNLPKGNHF